jgi:hypothetical protein
MTLTTILRQAEKLVADNSPHILTSIGVAGTITTAVLTGKASLKAARLIDRKQQSLNIHDHGKMLTYKDKAYLVWKLYIPPAAVMSVTVASIIMANQIGTRRAAVMAAAYTSLQKAGEEYREKVIEKLGETKEQSVHDEVMQDNMANKPVSQREVIITGGGNALCFDAYTGRYFLSSMEEMKKAVNDLNHRIISHFYASLNEFYDLLGLDNVDVGEDMGWSTDELLEPRFGTQIADDGRPCLTISFDVKPIRGYNRVS